ncbi:MAG: ABC transporter substrate-binding protein [Oscillospiraceae bacterium]|nr:ABC transporter substrate-binding protein [Oscillospiraceae bacterium]
MKKGKKLIALLVVMLMCVALFASCKGGNDNNNNNTNTNTDSNTNSNSNTDSNSNSNSNTDSNSNSNANNQTSTDGGQASGIVSARDNLTVVVTMDGGTLDPVYLYTNDIQNALGLIYDTLWVIDENDNIDWRVATALDRSDPLKWIITIRDDVYFENGNKLTASDVLFSLTLVENRRGEPALFGNVDFDNSRVIDDTTIEVCFSIYNINIVYYFATTFLFDEESFDYEKVAYETMGSGPYTLQDYVVNSHMILKKRDGYWGTPALIDTITFRVMVEEAQRVNALQTGEVDISSVPFQDIEFVKTLPNCEVLMTSTTMTTSLWFNTHPDRGLFTNNLDARLAVAHAIDPQAVLNVAFSGYGNLGRAPYSSAITDVFPALLDLGIYDHGYDPELARSYAEKAGLMDKTLVLINNGSPSNVTTCELIHGFMKDIGVTVEIRSYDMGSWLAVVFDGSAWDMSIDFTAGNTVAQALQFWWAMQAGGDYANPDSISTYPGKDRYIELASDIMSVTDRAELDSRYQEMTDILIESVIYMTLVESVGAQAYNPNLVLPRLMYGAIDYKAAYWAS